MPVGDLGVTATKSSDVRAVNLGTDVGQSRVKAVEQSINNIIRGASNIGAGLVQSDILDKSVIETDYTDKAQKTAKDITLAFNSDDPNNPLVKRFTELRAKGLSRTEMYETVFNEETAKFQGDDKFGKSVYDYVMAQNKTNSMLSVAPADRADIEKDNRDRLNSSMEFWTKDSSRVPQKIDLGQFIVKGNTMGVDKQLVYQDFIKHVFDRADRDISALDLLDSPTDIPGVSLRDTVVGQKLIPQYMDRMAQRAKARDTEDKEKAKLYSDGIVKNADLWISKVTTAEGAVGVYTYIQNNKDYILKTGEFNRLLDDAKALIDGDFGVKTDVNVYTKLSNKAETGILDLNELAQWRSSLSISDYKAISEKVINSGGLSDEEKNAVKSNRGALVNLMGAQVGVTGDILGEGKFVKRAIRATQLYDAWITDYRRKNNGALPGYEDQYNIQQKVVKEVDAEMPVYQNEPKEGIISPQKVIDITNRLDTAIQMNDIADLKDIDPIIFGNLPSASRKKYLELRKKELKAPAPTADTTTPK